MQTVESIHKGQPRMWSIYPFKSNLETSVRVNQLINHETEPPSYLPPAIEVSACRILTATELRNLRTALDQAELKAAEWEHLIGVSIYEPTL